MVPSAGQGIVGVTVRAADMELHELLAASRTRRPRPSPRPSARCWRRWMGPAARRSAAMRGCCRMAQLHLTGLVARADGTLPAEAQRCRARRRMRRGSGRNWATACAPTARRYLLADGLRDGVLITRAEDAARETGALVHAMGLRPVLAPLSTIVPLAAAFPPFERVQAVLVTSGNAISGLPQAYRRAPLLAVGDATARLAEAAGFADVRSASGDADALAAMTQAQCDPDGKPLVLATGEGQGGALASALRALGFIVLRRVAYVVRPVDALPESARMALVRGGLRAALF